MSNKNEFKVTLSNKSIELVAIRPTKSFREYVVLGKLNGAWATWVANDFHKPGSGELGCNHGHYYEEDEAGARAEFWERR